MLAHRLRRWLNIVPAVGDRLVFAGMSTSLYTDTIVTNPGGIFITGWSTDPDSDVCLWSLTSADPFLSCSGSGNVGVDIWRKHWSQSTSPKSSFYSVESTTAILILSNTNWLFCAKRKAESRQFSVTNYFDCCTAWSSSLFILRHT